MQACKQNQIFKNHNVAFAQNFLICNTSMTSSWWKDDVMFWLYSYRLFKLTFDDRTWSGLLLAVEWQNWYLDIYIGNGSGIGIGSGSGIGSGIGSSDVLFALDCCRGLEDAVTLPWMPLCLRKRLKKANRKRFGNRKIQMCVFVIYFGITQTTTFSTPPTVGIVDWPATSQGRVGWAFQGS